MTSDHWPRVEALYARVSELPAAERDRVLAVERQESPEVVAEVESLLASEPSSDQFLSTPWLPGQGPFDQEPSLTGRTVGAFRLLDPIGHGGMGVVYRAEREDAGFAQQVAIKVVTAARWHRGSLKQFKAERQLLAALHHPHIVTLMDGGVTDDGLAYLAMEYVDGTPITRYCREHRLPLHARLALFQQVCAAVQYAHRHAVVHRDLKPANILVTPDGVPKVLDFGIARLLTNPIEGATHTTVGWLRAMTPDYASPEQIRGLPASAADDEYALGVLLFELLAGRLPVDTAGRPLDDVLRTVVDQPSPRPSSMAPPDWHAVAPSELRGDLDAIVLKAIDKDPARRYGSAQELSDDVGRHLAGQVVVAREPSVAYVLATLARRHRALVTATAISAIAVLAALGVSIVQTRRAVTERDRADQRFSDVRRLANSLIFDIHDAVTPLPGSTPVREKIVAEALKYLEVLAREGGDDALRIELAEAYRRVATVQGNPSGPNLGDREGAVASYEKAVALLAPVADRSSEAATALVRIQLAMLPALNALGRADSVQSTARAATEYAEQVAARAPGEEDARSLLGSAYFWRATFAPPGQKPGQSIEWWLKTSAVFEAQLADEPDNSGRQRNAALAAKYLGEQYRQLGELEKALAQHQRAQELDARRVAAAPDNRQAKLDLALDWANLGGLSRAMGKFVDAVVPYERSLAVRQELADTDPDDDYTQGRLAYAHMMLGLTYDRADRVRDAFTQLEASVRVNQSRRSADLRTRIELSLSLLSLAQVEQKRGRSANACAHFKAAQLGTTPEPDAVATNQRDWQRIAREVADGLAWCNGGAAKAGARAELTQPPRQ